ncbi:MAG: hypothetical protein GW946_02385 [Candidatus Pacebacteria bacterium]|nr:hypothetical protein [Candidatus Paceibacterota bacterium]PIR60021.1 MAG: hypothetical protein COU67_03725 [Candidatus Pacebacteria bacterium CG10_big_fil_rev_8_21_14_0_10_44_54]
MNRIAIFGTFLIASLCILPVTQAQDASESGRANQEIKKRIDRVIEEKKQEVAGALAEINTKKRGFVGPIERVTENTITLTTHKGPLVIPLNAQVKVLRKSEEIEVTDLVVDDWVVALGIEVDGMFEPKYILSSNASEKPKERVVLLGTLSVLERNSLSLQTRGSKEQKAILLAKSTEYQNSDGSEVSLQDLEEDLTVLVIAEKDETDLTATTIRSLAPLEIQE